MSANAAAGSDSQKRGAFARGTAAALAVRDHMSRFDVYLGDRLLGWSELESGDPPMGVVFGRFMPTAEYNRSVVANSDQNQVVLSVRTSSGMVLEASGGVHITDHSAELGPEGIEVSVLGIPQPTYEALFPSHVAAYERQFKNS